MTPAELRTARKSLGMTQHELATALRMGKWGFQTVSLWEKDGNTIPGPVQVAIEAMLADRKRMERDNDNPSGRGTNAAGELK